MRPRCKAGRKPRDNIIIGGRSNARWPSGGNPPVQARSRLRACGARPSPGRLPHMDNLAGRTWDRRERRFFRTDALCASALQDIMNGKDFHYRRWLGERSVV